MGAFLLLRKGAFAVASSLCLDKYMYIHYTFMSTSIYCIQLETWIPLSFLPLIMCSNSANPTFPRISFILIDSESNI